RSCRAWSAATAVAPTSPRRATPPRRRPQPPVRTESTYFDLVTTDELSASQRSAPALTRQVRNTIVMRSGVWWRYRRCGGVGRVQRGGRDGDRPQGGSARCRRPNERRERQSCIHCANRGALTLAPWS